MNQVSVETITVAIPSVLSNRQSHNYSSRIENDVWSNLETNPCSESSSTSLESQYMNDILGVILNDTYEDGTITKSEEYIKTTFCLENSENIKSAIMKLYLSNLENPHVLTGLLTMIGCIPYNVALPQCQIMALGLLQNRDISIRDKAIQVFEKWNSKSGIPVLKSLKCDKKWLQKYVDKVIQYLERDGEA